MIEEKTQPVEKRGRLKKFVLYLLGLGLATSLLSQLFHGSDEEVSFILALPLHRGSYDT